MAEPFADRREAGRLLAAALRDYADRRDAIVLALPRGGVPVGYEVAAALRLPLDVWLVRKVGVPGNAELAMGAVGDGGACVIDHALMRTLGLDQPTFDQIAERERQELQRRAEAYRGARGPANVTGRCVILVDDGLASGSTMCAAAQDVRRQRPQSIIIAVPVAPGSTCRALEPGADRVICLRTPVFFGGVGKWYVDFTQTPDDEVRCLLADAAARAASPGDEADA